MPAKAPPSLSNTVDDEDVWGKPSMSVPRISDEEVWGNPLPVSADASNRPARSSSKERFQAERHNPSPSRLRSSVAVNMKLVQQLMGMGYTSDQATMALRINDNNTERYLLFIFLTQFFIIVYLGQWIGFVVNVIWTGR
jgi:hypothetical protein